MSTHEADAEPRAAAVLLLLYPGPDGEPHVPFMQRTAHLTRHQGQIALPGGARDPADATLLETARREAWEELGIDPDGYEVVGELPVTFTAISNFLVTPFVAVAAEAPVFRPDPYEVAAVLEIPLAQLAAPANWRAEMMDRPDGRRLVRFCQCGPHTVWGLTARIVHEFLEAQVSDDARAAFERRVRHGRPGA